MEFGILIYVVFALFNIIGAQSASFTIMNNCSYTIWPATATSTGTSVLTGFELASKASSVLAVTSPWSGRVWTRTSCTNSGKFTCQTGDCGSGKVECSGASGVPPASLVEFNLAGYNNRDFYDISLVDGFNVPVSVQPGGSGCSASSCAADINKDCPQELAVVSGSATVGCKSACVAFNQPQYCCTGDYGTPDKCPPTNYSKMFKSHCPQAHSYAYDDKACTFTCPTGGNYTITFCP